MCGLCYKRSWTGDGRHESTSRTGYLAMPTMLDSRRARCMGKCAPTRRDQLRKNCCPSKATSKTVHTSARVGMWRVPLHVRDRSVRRGGFCISSDHCNCIISIVSFFFFFFGHCQACGISTVEHWFSFCQLFLAVLLVQEASMCARANRMCTHLSFLEKLTRD